MRNLIVVLASMALAGCGGLGEPSPPSQSCAQSPQRERAPLEGVEVLPALEVQLEFSWARQGAVLELEQVPVEERFFYPVDVNMPPPELPPPACPACS